MGVEHRPQLAREDETEPSVRLPERSLVKHLPIPVRLQGGDGNRVEERLRASEERFQQFADHSSDLLWIVDTISNQIEYRSLAFERIWGVPLDVVSDFVSVVGEPFFPPFELECRSLYQPPPLRWNAVALISRPEFTADFKAARRELRQYLGLAP